MQESHHYVSKISSAKARNRLRSIGQFATIRRYFDSDEGEAMNWLTNTLGSSIGKKLLMAITGLCFCGFLAMHLAGNLTIYNGGNTFNNYAERLHSLGALLTIAELGLVFFALVHVIMGLLLFLENRKARPVAYAVKKSAGGQTFGATTMPYTGQQASWYFWSGADKAYGTNPMVDVFSHP